MEPSEVTSERDPLLAYGSCVTSMATPQRSFSTNKSGHILNSDSGNIIFHCYTDLKLSMDDAILGDKIKQVTAQNYRKSIQQVMEVEAKFRLHTSGSEHIQPIIIPLGEDNTDESDNCCELSSIKPFGKA
ncbi:hypothetical protein MRX96_018731 [Rhipicephalus microplus]